MKKYQRKLLALLFVSIFMIFTCSDLQATRSRKKEVTCPVCKKEFNASLLMSTNTFGGYDSDLCMHARGSSPLHLRIWSCPSCFFSGYSSDFDQNFSDQKKAELKKWLKQNFKFPNAEKQNSYDTIPSYKRYEIAAELAKKNNEKSLSIGRLYLNAAWCCRQLGFIYNTERSNKARMYSRPVPAFKKMWENIANKIKPSENNAADSADIYMLIAKNINSYDIPENHLAGSYYFLATLIRSTGENQLATKWLNKCLELDDSFKNDVEAYQNSIKQEAFYQKKAVKFLQEAISKGELQPGQNQEILVTLADTYRRIGESDKSVKTYMKIFELEEISPVIINLIQKAFKKMSRSDELPTRKIEQIQRTNIEKALTALEYPMGGSNAARYLREVENRDLVFPKLVEFATDDNPSAAKNAILAMSDDTPEAVQLQIKLFAKGKFQDAILNNFKKLSTPVPAEPLLEVFNSKEPFNLPVELIDILAAIDDTEAKKALKKKAEEFFTIENIKKFSQDGIKKTTAYKRNPELAYRNLINSLGGSCNLEALKVLQRIMENAQTNRYNFGYDMLKEAGIATEFITNHYFGFSIVRNREREPEFKQPEVELNKNAFGSAKSNFKKWLKDNKDEDYQEIVYNGFKEAGYNVLPVYDPECLKELITGLEDKFVPVRYHSYRELEKRTGISFKPLIGRDTGAYPTEYAEIVWFYNDWYKNNKNNLVFNKEKGRFEIKNEQTD